MIDRLAGLPTRARIGIFAIVAVALVSLLVLALTSGPTPPRTATAASPSTGEAAAPGGIPAATAIAGEPTGAPAATPATSPSPVAASADLGDLASPVSASHIATAAGVAVRFIGALSGNGPAASRLATLADTADPELATRLAQSGAGEKPEASGGTVRVTAVTLLAAGMVVLDVDARPAGTGPTVAYSVTVAGASRWQVSDFRLARDIYGE